MLTSRATSLLTRTLLALLACAAVGCASPTGPSSTASSPAAVPDASAARVQLTVRVLARATETPVAGALVHVLGDAGRTDDNGLCRFAVRSGDLADVEVSADGFDGLGASGVLAGDERWTFYLAPLDGD